MDAEFWLERWRSGDIGFHQPDGHDLLRKHWPGLGAAAGAAVFVPLAGKSVDMHWLAAQGQRVIGVELSEQAVDDFFSGADLTPLETREGSFVVKSDGPYTIYCGNIFELESRHLDGVSSAYDRAALIALPATLRPLYAAHLAELLRPGTTVLLISIVYPDGEIEGPPFSVSQDEIARLFGGAFEIAVLETRDGLAASPNLRARNVTRMDETIYVLRRRS
ncbi:MAG: thiopurine S-methyltransferase [Hyphomicrobium sp.]